MISSVEFHVELEDSRVYVIFETVLAEMHYCWKCAASPDVFEEECCRVRAANRDAALLRGLIHVNAA